MNSSLGPTAWWSKGAFRFTPVNGITGRHTPETNDQRSSPLPDQLCQHNDSTAISAFFNLYPASCRPSCRAESPSIGDAEWIISM